MNPKIVSVSVVISCLNEEETLITCLKNAQSARKLTRARILLKVDEGEFGPPTPMRK